MFHKRFRTKLRRTLSVASLSCFIAFSHITATTHNPNIAEMSLQTSKTLHFWNNSKQLRNIETQRKRMHRQLICKNLPQGWTNWNLHLTSSCVLQHECAKNCNTIHHYHHDAGWQWTSELEWKWATLQGAKECLTFSSVLQYLEHCMQIRACGRPSRQLTNAPVLKCAAG